MNYLQVIIVQFFQYDASGIRRQGRTIDISLIVAMLALGFV